MARLCGIPGIVGLILVVELLERFCYYTIQGSQKSFMNQKLNYGNAQATTISLVWGTLCYITCLGGGVLGDRVLGRFLTIASLASWYAAGCFLVAVSTLPSLNSRSLFLAGTFAGVAVGTGGIKPLVCNFGADQIDGEGEETNKVKEAFFSWFYWTIQIGAAVALGFMTTLATTPTTFGLPANMGYFISYIAAAGGMTGALGLFFTGSCSFRGKALTGSTRIFRPIGTAFLRAAGSNTKGKVALTGWVFTVPFFVCVFWQAFAHGTLQTVLAWLAFGIAMLQFFCLCWAHADNSFLGARRDQLAADMLGQNPDEVGLAQQDVRLTFQTIPLLLIANIVFNFAYSMMLGPFFNQSCQMDLRLGDTQINGAVFNLADTLVIIVFIPLFEGYVFPLIARRQGRPLEAHQKLLLGFFFAFLAMVSAAALELIRRGSPIIAPKAYLDDPKNLTAAFPGFHFHGDGAYSSKHYTDLMGECMIDGKQWCSNCAAKKPFPFDSTSSKDEAGIYMSQLSGFWMFIPYALVGLGEICVNPVLYFYAYANTPERTRSVVQAVNLVFQGAYPPALTGVFITAFATAMPNNLNEGRIEGWQIGLEVFYYIGATFIAIGSPLFLVVRRKCTIIEPREDEPALSERQNPSILVAGAQEGSFPHASSFG